MASVKLPYNNAFGALVDSQVVPESPAEVRDEGL